MTTPLPASIDLPSLDALDAESARRRLAAFVRRYWSVVEPAAPLVWNWHLDAICEHLEAVTAGHIRRLIINVPPGHMKSLLVSVFWPAWVWASSPGWRSLFGSYAEGLAVRDSIKCRSIIESARYRADYCEPDGWSLLDDQNAKAEYGTTQRGHRISVGVGGKATGLRGDAVVVDDPLNALEAQSPAVRQRAIEWWDLAMSTRLNNAAKGAHVVIMQRLHEDDLTGHLLRRGGYEHLRLPSEFEPKHASVTCGGLWRDPRTEEGELLFPALFPAEVLADAKVALGEQGYSEQHRQNPTPRGGGLFKAAWWKRYRQAPRLVHRWAASVDCTFKGKEAKSKKADFVVMQVWACVGAHRYLVWQSRKRMSFTETKAAVKRMAERWHLDVVLVEDKANGPAIIDELRDEVPGIIAVDPGQAGKEARAAAVTPLVEAGQVWIPEDESGNVQVWNGTEYEDTGGWEADTNSGKPVDTFLAELGGFPRAANDDQVDALSQALRWLREAPTARAPINAVAMPIGRSRRLDI